MKNLYLLLLSLFVILILNTCKKEDSPAPKPEETKNEYNVTYTENTVVIDSLVAQSLVKIDSADHRYYFESNDPAITNLKENDIILIYGVALRRVTNVSRNGNETIVETSYATLNEAISDGVLSWDKEITFKKGIIPEVQMAGKNIQFKSATADGFEFEFTYGKYKYRIKFDFGDEKADVELEVTKDLVQPISAKFLAKGSIQNFTTHTEMEFENSKLKNFGQKNSDLSGDLTLNLTVAGSGNDGLTFDFPVVLLKYPVMVGPIPVMINLKVLFVINCVVPIDGSAQVEVKFSYNSTAGVKYNGTTVSADANMGEPSIEKKISQTGASSAIGVNFGLAFPRVEIGVFDEVIVPWVQTAFLIGGDYTFTPPCQQAKAQFIGACGLDLSFLGFGYSANKTLWQEEKVLLKSGDCP
jgi:hypothetical protein